MWQILMRHACSYIELTNDFFNRYNDYLIINDFISRVLCVQGCYLNTIKQFQESTVK